MRNITRWLANHYGKQREQIRYKPSDRYTQWVRWPTHITAPVKADMAYLDSLECAIGVVYSPGGNIRVVYHPSFMWYYDGDHSVAVACILFPDGSEWWPLHATSDS